MREIEILSPAGDFECLKSAILFKADAVYLGGEIFGMRTASSNFSLDLLDKGVKFAHSNNVKIYLTCNTVPTNKEADLLDDFLKNAEEIGVDALIIADMGTLFAAKKFAPKIPIHISTQAGIMNYKTANALHMLGAKRIVLARELSLEEIKTIREKTSKELEIECFVHGAMCMSFSGRCLISSYLTNRDANRGKCSQPCRWKYHLMEEKRPGEFFPVFENENGSFILNSKDLCLIEYLDKLYDAGVCSFKIEGRAKSSYYVAVTTNAYLMAKNILKDSIKNNKEYILPEYIKEELFTISHRHYGSGFLFGPQKDGQYYEDGGYIRCCDIVAVVCEYDGKNILCKQKNKFSIGEEVELLIPQKKPLKFKIINMFDENKNKIISAPNSEMIVNISYESDVKILKGSIIRRKIK